METTPQLNSKKCPHCGLWSEHQGLLDDRCGHCHELLDPNGPRKYAELQEAWKWQMPKVMLITIDPADPWPLRLLKYLVRGGQLLFIATLSFIVWLVTMLAG